MDIGPGNPGLPSGDRVRTWLGLGFLDLGFLGSGVRGFRVSGFNLGCLRKECSVCRESSLYCSSFHSKIE